jgi:hypothetical protein
MTTKLKYLWYTIKTYLARRRLGKQYGINRALTIHEYACCEFFLNLETIPEDMWQTMENGVMDIETLYALSPNKLLLPDPVDKPTNTTIPLGPGRQLKSIILAEEKTTNFDGFGKY